MPIPKLIIQIYTYIYILKKQDLPSVKPACTSKRISCTVSSIPLMISQRYLPVSSIEMSVITREASSSSCSCRKTRSTKLPQVFLWNPIEDSTSSFRASSSATLVHLTRIPVLPKKSLSLARSRQGKVTLAPRSAITLAEKDQNIIVWRQTYDTWILCNVCIQ